MTISQSKQYLLADLFSKLYKHLRRSAKWMIILLADLICFQNYINFNGFDGHPFSRYVMEYLLTDLREDFPSIQNSGRLIIIPAYKDKLPAWGKTELNISDQLSFCVGQCIVQRSSHIAKFKTDPFSIGFSNVNPFQGPRHFLAAAVCRVEQSI